MLPMSIPPRDALKTGSNRLGPILGRWRWRWWHRWPWRRLVGYYLKKRARRGVALVTGGDGDAKSTRHLKGSQGEGGRGAAAGEGHACRNADGTCMTGAERNEPA